MYYVSANIVKPLTEPFQLSFAEVVGPTTIAWFVSHYALRAWLSSHAVCGRAASMRSFVADPCLVFASMSSLRGV